MPMIRECILTTVSGEGAVHVAPLGIIRADPLPGGKDGWCGAPPGDERWIVAPFRPSTTLANLEATGWAVANYTDEARIFAGCLTGRRDWPLRAVEGCPAPRLEAALAHDVLRVERIEDDAVRPRLVCRVERSETHGAFPGLNRAKAAVVELAILVSRLALLPRDKVEAEIGYLRIAVDKTAGPDEREAWGWLMERVEAYWKEAAG